VVKRITFYFAKLLNLLGILLDIREVIAIIVGGSMTSILAAIIAIIRNSPLYVVILFIILIILLTALVLALILGKMGRSNRIQRVPQLLKQINQRNTKLALNLSKNLKEQMTPEFAHEFAQLVNVADYENKIASKFGKLPIRMEINLTKRVNKAIANDIPKLLDNLSALTEKYHFSLTNAAQKDFEYLLLYNQLENLRPFPTAIINSLVENYIDYSKGLNTFLMFQQSYIEDVDRLLSQTLSLTNRRYMDIMSKKMNELLVIIENAIRVYMKEQKR